MNNRKQEKQQSKSGKRMKDKILSPNLLKIAKNKIKNHINQPSKNPITPHYKTLSKFNEPQTKNSLFNSLRELPLKYQTKHKPKNDKKIKVSLQKNAQNSTASRQFHQHLKANNQPPNRQYFGGKLSSIENKNARHPNNFLRKNKNERNNTHSLEKKIHQYRRMSRQHRSESESMKSQISDKEMLRLTKLQSIEKMCLMEQIMDMESKRLHLKTQK